MTDQERIKKAQLLIEDKKYDLAIDLLREKDAPNDFERCELLAYAYYYRGDAKGDVYSSHFFAQRAIELGSKNQRLYLILGIASFRRGRYNEAFELMNDLVKEDSKASIKFIFSIVLMQLGHESDASKWLSLAQKDDPNNLLYSKGLEPFRSLRYNQDNLIHIPMFGNMFQSKTIQLKASDEKDIDSPYAHNAVSKLRGYGKAPKDFDWLDKNIPCQSACPAGTNIPEYLTAIYEGEYDRAYRINLEDNVFPGVLGRVCARPCESECRHGWEGLGESVAICWSKRSSSDHKEESMVTLDHFSPPTEKRITIIGAGVAGLACARQLARLGHEVKVLEKHKKPGGMLVQGIPVFRLPRDVVQREIDQVKALGVAIECGVEVGKDISLQEVYDDCDALVLAAGTLKPNLLDLPGKELKGIHHGLDFLLNVNEGDGFQVGHRVAVIGGGFTAMDCARTAWRLGAKEVKVLYRRSQTEMLITPGELEELEKEGIPMDFMVSPVEFIGDENGRVKGIRFVKNRLGAPDESGRARPEAIPGSEFELPVDSVLLATGQFPDTSWIPEPLKASLVDSSGWLLDEGKNSTTKKKVFLAGDFSTGAKSLINAIGHSKETAKLVDQYLMGKKRIEEYALVEDVQSTGRIREMDHVPLQPMPMIPKEKRGLEEEVEQGFSKPEAVEETQRCYRCHYKFEIDNDKCIYCDWCIKAKPRPECIIPVKEFSYDEEGRIKGWEEAKTVEEKKYIYINQEDCIRCGACVNACPVDAISVQKVQKKTLCNGGSLLPPKIK